MTKTNIEWADYTWNPVTGCTKTSSGCKNCYAEIMHKRLHAMNIKKYAEPFENVIFNHDALSEPYKVKKPSIVFVNSMSDLFHKNVKTADILRVLQVIEENPQHIFIILTKRYKRAAELSSYIDIFRVLNLYIGFSICDNEMAESATLPFRGLRTPRKIISFEPLLEDIKVDTLKELIPWSDWCIVGGETGKGARMFYLQWAEKISKHCQEYEVPYFFKKGYNGEKYRDDRPVFRRDYPHLITNQIKL